MKISIESSRELASALHNVSLGAGTDSTLPTLQTVKLEAAGGTLTLTSTDRFALHRQTVACEVADAGELLIATSDLKRILSLLRAAPRGASKWGVEIITVEIITTESNAEVRTIDGASVTFRGVEGDFPNVVRIIESFRAGEVPFSVEAFGITPALIARLDKLRNDKDAPLKGAAKQLRIELDTATRPMRITNGNLPTLTVLVMPVRIAS